ncbi:MAG: GNAT family N-acetyltransferase [Gemmatimonadales bacterium]
MSVTVEPIVLRAPDPTDRDQVSAMVRAVGAFRDSEVAIALEVFDDATTNPGKDYFGLGAYDCDRLVGFTLYGRTPGTETTWDLYWIVVDPEGHRRGIGRQLMDATEAAMREQGGTLIVVETSSRDDYGPTRNFYEALLYDQAAYIADYYAPGDDLIVFTKRFPSQSKTGDHG